MSDPISKPMTEIHIKDALSTERFNAIGDWIFDLDNTLYRADMEFFGQIDKKMTAYISAYLDVDAAQARKTQKQYLVEYGTSLSGLMAVHNMDPADFLHQVHDVDLSLLKPEPDLRAAIKALPGRKFIYTNGSRAHAENVAGHLQILDLFEGSFAIEDAGYIPKPQCEGFEIFNKRFDIDPQKAMFFEDNLRNLSVPHQMGMASLLVTPTNGQDFAHEPEAARPGALNAQTSHIDVITSDLSGWLNSRLS